MSHVSALLSSPFQVGWKGTTLTNHIPSHSPDGDSYDRVYTQNVASKNFCPASTFLLMQIQTLNLGIISTGFGYVLGFCVCTLWETARDDDVVCTAATGSAPSMVTVGMGALLRQMLRGLQSLCIIVTGEDSRTRHIW